MTAARPMRVIFGGTFDPVHHGHLRLALEVGQVLGVPQVSLLPAGVPPHRTSPAASAEDRLAMVRLAIADEPALAVDDRELRRAGCSYMVDTLAELRAECGDECSLVLVIGNDAFAGFHRWHRWLEIVQFAHIIVLSRPGDSADLDPELLRFLEARQVASPAQLNQHAAGFVLPLCLSRLDISSTRIRADLARNLSPRFLIPDTVLAYIRDHGLYPPVRTG